MTVPDSYLTYPRRKPGTDTSMFVDRRLEQVESFTWPGGARIAVSVVVNLQHFPLDMGKTPFVPTGGLERFYPDIWNYTMRDYGNRVGIYRLMATFDALGIRPTVFANSDIADRYPVLIEDIDSRGWEIAASGRSMGQLHHSGLSESEERSLIKTSIERLQKASSRPVRGWASPAGHQSPRTLDLLAEAGVDYVTDFVNDELPFPLSTANGPMTALPVGTELSDVRLIVQQHHSTAEYAAEVMAAHAFLRQEAVKSGRLLTLSVTPWIMGQAHRTVGFETMLAKLQADGETSFMDCASVLDGWRARKTD
ncbi:MAG: polysaccharide deacetylase family protein [Mesorhizobium sp.]